MKKINNIKVLLPLIFFAILNIQHVYAITLDELQELRLAKAELAYGDGKSNEALKILYHNISRRKFHLGTYELLAEIYINRRDYVKGFRAYYYALKKIHHEKIIYSSGKKLKSTLKNAPAPSKQALDIYFKVARKYFEVYEAKVFSKEMDSKLIQLAFKYYTVLEFYKYDLANTKYTLSLITKRMKKYNIAIEKVLQAKELYTKQDKQSNDDSTSDLDFLLGDLLVRHGNSDAGSIYLKTLFLSKNTSQSLKEYARVYLESLSESYTSIGFNYGYTTSNNVNFFTSDIIEDFSIYEDTYKRVTGLSQDFSVSLYHSSSKWGNWQFINNIGMSQSSFIEEDLAYGDSRYYNFGTTIKYDNLSKSLFKLSYSLNMLYTKADSSSSYAKSYLINTLYFQYSHILKAGTISYKIPFILYDNIAAEDTSDIGIELSYTPYYIGDIWSPSFTYGYSIIGATEGFSSSTQSTFSMSNHLKQSDASSFFFDPSYTIYGNSDESVSYKQISAALTWSWYYSYFGVSQAMGVTWKKKDYTIGTSATDTSGNISWSYNF